jgi:hypothetical protein
MGYLTFRLFPVIFDIVLRDSFNSTSATQSQSQNYVTTDGQSTSLSWCQAPICGLRPDFSYCQTVAGLLMWGALSDERNSLPFTIAAGPRQHSHSWVRVQRDSSPYFTLSDLRLPNLEGQFPVFISPQEHGSPVIPPSAWVPFSSPPTTRRATL